ncbi:DUF6708 domain-containing protein [Herbaspirillum rubrisubalbicans]|uniref:DUF6708 domain-containing protein n=1 Tax=Herbaspirillum rubrisubalbicans TaxID=80842 RepID=UPI0012F6C5FE|nr:DUF6708 domain-containing protein [Herbaspirillum rubrisubalbicans]
MKKNHRHERHSRRRSTVEDIDVSLDILPHESEFVLYHWTGEQASDVFFGLNSNPAFKGLGDEAILLPPHSLSISRTPQAGSFVLETYPHGLAYADGGASITGFFAFSALFASLGFIWGIEGMVLAFMRGSAEVFIELVIFISLVVLGLMIWFTFRLDTSGYRYAPILFDRAAGKVHVFTDKTSLFSLLPLWGGGKYDIQSYDWSCTRVQVCRSRVVTKNHTQILASLHCVVIKGPKDDTVIAQFPLGGTVSSLAVQLLLNQWEHIRRFMQHEGPLLNEGEQVYVPHGSSLLRALCWSQPLIGPGRYPFTFLMLLAQLFALCFLWFTIPYGLLGWVCYHLKSKPKWPAEILSSVGRH